MTKAQPKRKRTCEECGGVFLAGPRARFCPVCRPARRRAKATKYLLTEPVKQLLKTRYNSGVPGRAAEIAAQLEWPVWVVRRMACKLSLTRPWPKSRRRWTVEEKAFLQKWSGVRSSSWIAKQINRSETSVVLKQRYLRLSRRVRNGYSVRELSECFGIDHYAVVRWIDLGMIRAQVQITHRLNNVRRIQPDEIRRFIREHREEYRLDKVDQDWFLALLFDEDDPPAGGNGEARPCTRCGRLFSAERYAKICPGCRKNRDRIYLPSPEEIRRRAEAIRQEKGFPPSSCPLDSDQE